MNPVDRPFSLSSQGSCTASCGVRLLWLAFILLSVSGWLRIVDTIVRWEWLEYAGVLPGTLYLAITGGMWGIAGLLAAFWILQGRSWGRLVSLAVMLFYVLTYWIDRLFFAQAPGTASNTIFALLVTAIILLVSVLILRPFADLRRFIRRCVPVGPAER